MKLKQIIKILCLAFLIWGVSVVVANAASASISASSRNVTTGTKVTITAKGSAAAWDLTLSGDGISSAAIVGYTNDAENGSFSKSASFTPTKAGTYTFTLSGNITDEDNTESTPINKSVTVTVKSKSSGSSSSGSSSSGSSGSGSSSSSSSGSSSSSKSDDDDKPSFSSVNETVYANDSVNIRASYSTSSSLLGSLEKGDSITRTGKGDNGWSKVSYNGQTAYIKSSFLTTEKPEESNNKALKSLTVAEYKLTPDFSSDVTEYSLTVGADVESLDIDATAEDDASKVEITGNDNLLMGENTIEIKVTAEDGTVRTYKINVTKGEGTSDVFGLTELTIEGYTLNPEFSANVYEYTLDIADTSVSELNVQAVASEEDAEVEIVGNTELKMGENIITIIVRNEAGEIATYQIKVNITDPAANQIIAGIDNNDLFLYGGIGIGALILLIIIIVVIVRRSRKNNNDDDPYYGGFTSMNRDVNNDDKPRNIVENNADENKAKEEDTRIGADFASSEKTGMTTDADFGIGSDARTEHRRSVIEENFGADIDAKNLNFGDEEDVNRRRGGKHF